MIQQVSLVASGDSRLSANRACWPAQAELEATLARTFDALGCRTIPDRRHLAVLAEHLKLAQDA